MATSVIALLNDPGHGLTVLEGPDGRPRILANTLAGKLGYPRTERLLALVKDTEQGTMEVQTAGGRQVASYVTVPGMLRAMGSRPVSRITDPAMRATVEWFQDWIYEDVVPQIVVKGEYLTDERRKVIAGYAVRLRKAVGDAMRGMDAKDQAKGRARTRSALDLIAFEFGSQWLESMAGREALAEADAQSRSGRTYRAGYPDPTPVAIHNDSP